MVPHVRFDEQSGRDCWFAGDKNLARSPTPLPLRVDEGHDTGQLKHVVAGLDDAVGLADMHPSAYDPQRRMKVLDERRIQAQVLEVP